jgi:hypothetical protein
MSQQKEESYSIAHQEDLIKGDMEVLAEAEDVEDLVEKPEDR